MHGTIQRPFFSTGHFENGRQKKTEPDFFCPESHLENEAVARQIREILTGFQTCIPLYVIDSSTSKGWTPQKYMHSVRWMSTVPIESSEVVIHFSLSLFPSHLSSSMLIPCLSPMERILWELQKLCRYFSPCSPPCHELRKSPIEYVTDFESSTWRCS